MAQFSEGDLVKLPGEQAFVTVETAVPQGSGWRLYVVSDGAAPRKRDLTAAEAAEVVFLRVDGAADPAKVLAGLWAEWMLSSASSGRAGALGSSTLRPYPHQVTAVYGAMLPQPALRFLLADEPGTGKTIMAGLYIREMQRLGLIRRVLIVAPAHLVKKWQEDFDRFFGGGLARVTSAVAKEGPLRPDQDEWIVSLDLAAVNPRVQDVIRPAQAAWDLVVFDEAHRLTPTAETMYRVGQLLAYDTPRALLMTATPHRGKEWLFRSLLHLTDPEVFPPVEQPDDKLDTLRPGPVHILRRVKEELVGYDGATRLFRDRTAANHNVPLNAVEQAFYNEALAMVEKYFPATATTLASMVYGKRAASTLHSLAETLRRRLDRMGTALPTQAAADADPEGEDPPTGDEARVTHETSANAREERKDLKDIIRRLDQVLASADLPVSKWVPFRADCLAKNGVHPGNGQQAVVFTEFADTAEWLVKRLRADGFTAEQYSGRQPHPVREEVRRRFARREFQMIVSTDAGNEGIDLQTAHVLVNWDIPWSLVRLEQRMGRIHRVGQDRDVFLYNLIALGTRESDTLSTLMDNLVNAANQLDGKLFDSLSLVAERIGLDPERLLSRTYDPNDSSEAALAAAKAITQASIEAAARQAAAESSRYTSSVDLPEAIRRLNQESLERINPRIVEAFLIRLSECGLVQAQPHAAGDGIWLLKPAAGGPVLSGLTPRRGDTAAGGGVVVATSGEALTAATNAGANLARTIALGPAEPAFRALVSDTAQRLRPFLWQGGALVDPTSATEYELHAYRAHVMEGERRTLWPVLVRVGATGATPVRWELLANLAAAPSPSPNVLHPAALAEADDCACKEAEQRRVERASAMGDWLAAAERELRRLPDFLSSRIADTELRRAERRRTESLVAARIVRLKDIGRVTIERVERIGWAHVGAGGVPPDATESDSEEIAMRNVIRLLRQDGWHVDDVHLDGRGYDLLATRGRDQRLVEVKGVWDAASSQGVRLTANEVLIAAQHADDYWLYVIDECNDLSGRLYGAYRNPALLFAGTMTGRTFVSIPGSALSAARTEVVMP